MSAKFDETKLINLLFFASIKCFISVFLTEKITSPLLISVPFLKALTPINLPCTSEEIVILFKETTLPELLILFLI